MNLRCRHLARILAMVLILASLGALLGCEGESITIERTEDGAVVRSTGETSIESANISGPDTTPQQSVLQGQDPTPTPATDSTLSEVPAPPHEPAMIVPEGYYHAINHGLALAQTARRPSETRDGWMDIILHLVAISFSGGGLQVRASEAASVFCFGGAVDGPEPADCFSVKWGSTNQNEAELQVTGLESSEGHKAVNFQAAFVVAANATNASLYFGEHEIALDLQGDYARKDSHFPPLAAPVSSSGQDARTAGYFVGTENGIRLARVSRTYHSGGLVSTGRVRLWVLPLGDHHVPEFGDASGSVCLGMNATDCMEVTWGPENQFNAILSLDQAEAETFATARRSGARWPLPITVSFIMPAGHDGAVLKFGGHDIALDLRGMAGPPAVDYAAYYPEAAPGAVLYDSGGKTVVIDSVSHAPGGGIELSLTATNDSEGEDFAPVVIPDAVFSTAGRVDVSEGQRIFIADTLAPGQNSSIEYAVPRGGDETWGYVAYSEDPAKRPDAVVVRVADLYSHDGASGSDGGSFVPFTESARFGHDPQASFPVFARFQRSEDEGEFWPVKMLWRHPAFGFPLITPDGIVYLVSPNKDNFAVHALDAATGKLKWDYEFEAGNIPGIVGVSQGIVCAIYGNRLHIFDAETGELKWDRGFGGEVLECTVADGRVFSLSHNEFHLLDAATGEQLWEAEKEWQVKGGVKLADGQVYLGKDGRSGYDLVALDAATGEIIWEFDFPRERLLSFEVADGTVYGRSHDWLRALDAATGEEVWATRAVNRGDHTVSNGMVYDAGFMRLAVWDARTGEPVWERRINSQDYIYVYEVADGVVYAGWYEAGESQLFALDAGTGEQIWSHAGRRFHGFDLADGVVYLRTPDHEIHSVEASTGEFIWNSGVNAYEYRDATVANGVAFLSSDQYLYAFLATEK